MKHTRSPFKASEKAVAIANSFMPFILHPPATKYHDEVRDGMAESIQKFGETYWPEMNAQKNFYRTINVQLLEACKEAVSTIEMLMGDELNPSASISLASIQSAIAKSL